MQKNTQKYILLMKNTLTVAVVFFMVFIPAILSQAAEDDIAIQIIQQPESVTGALGTQAHFQVKANGEGLTYEWRYNVYTGLYGGVDNSSYETIVGENNKIDMGSEIKMMITKWYSGGTIWCHLKDAYGNEIDTQGCQITMDENGWDNIENVQLSNPVDEVDDMENCACKIWNCVWYGTYPQTEVKGQALTDDIINADYDGNNDAVVNGIRYHKMEYEDAFFHYTAEEDSAHMYIWNGTGRDETHYFIYEPIKWRVLEVKGKRCLLVSDRILDERLFSTIPDWLNGRGATSEGKIYGSFIDMAFSSTEQKAILQDDNNTDKIFLMKSGDLKAFRDTECGLYQDEFAKCHVTDYSAAKGVYMSNGKKGNEAYGTWWIGDREESDGRASYVDFSGHRLMNPSNYRDNGIRPALYLDITDTNIWQYAGTYTSLSSAMDSDTAEQVREIKCLIKGGCDKKSQNINGKSDKFEKIYTDEEFSLGVTTDGDGKLYYSSSNPDIVEVSADGIAKITGVGTAEITIIATGTEHYKWAKKKIPIDIKKATPYIRLEKDRYSVDGTTILYIKSETNSDGQILYESLNSDIVEIGNSYDGLINIKSAGDAVVRVYTNETSYYNKAETYVTIHVDKIDEMFLRLNGQMIKDNCVELNHILGIHPNSTYCMLLTKYSNEDLQCSSSDQSIFTVAPVVSHNTNIASNEYTIPLEFTGKSGTAYLTIATGETALYNSVTMTVKFTVADNGKKVIYEEDDDEKEYEIQSETKKEVSYSFNNATSKQVTVPDTVKIDGEIYKVTKIKAATFANNKNITKITIGKNVTVIEKNAFKNCKNLKSIVVKSKVLKKVGSNALKGTNKKLKITVPKKKLKAYKKLFKGKGNKKIKYKAK